MPVRPFYASFLVRLWREAEPTSREMDADWQGEAEHIQTSQRWRFRTLEELLSFLRQSAEKPEVPGQPAEK
jgi:hypothetical protein